MQNKSTLVEERLGRTMQDKLEEMKGKLHLEECERKVLYAWTEQERHVNEGTIIQLRHEVKKKRVDLAESINAEAIVIKNAFVNKRVEQLSMKRLSAKKAVAEMDQKACERAKILNDLRHCRRTREQKLKDMRSQLTKERKILEKPIEHLSLAQRLRGLENSLDKARMKVETANNIGDQYKQVIKKLKEESMYFPARLDTMEAAVIEVHQELANLKRMNKEAERNRDLGRTELSRIEKDVHSAKRKRDSTLTNVKKDVERRRQELGKPAEKKTTKSQPHLEDGQAERKAILHAKLKSENQLQLLKYDSLFSEIKHRTGLTRLADFVERFHNQNDVQHRLLLQSARCQHLTTKLRREKEDMQKALVELRYSLHKRLSQGQDRLGAIADDCESRKETRDKTQETMKEQGKLLIGMTTGLKTIFEKLVDIKLPPPTHDRLTGDVEMDTGLICEKFDRLLASLGDNNAKKINDFPDLHEILEQQLGDENIRVQFKTSTTSVHSQFEYEHNDSEEVPTRDDIKLKAQLLMESKMKPKKRKKKLAQ
ncbi:outer dynein arm-docking complex subunit 3-like [Lineus longissimus]|uniref:outer dynein arm-docking complex subunit 3-like n=1 Tax=Lineus longissimus TaxID=88925 RepID=UPI00315C9B0C